MKSLIAGESGVGPITAFDAEGYGTTIAAEVKDFDPAGIVGRKQARRMDRFVQLGAAAALEAIDDSGVTIGPENSERVSVMIASGIGGIITLSDQVGVLGNRGPNRISPFLVPMMLPDMASGQVSMLTGAKGPNYSTVSACSSAADTIGQAFEAIRRGDVDTALAGGSEAAICPIGVAGFNACHALSKRNDDPEKASRPFDADRDGFVLGEGGAVLVLESLDSAIKRGAEPVAEITGYGSTADAYHITQPAPEGEGAARAMNKALAQAQTQPRGDWIRQRSRHLYSAQRQVRDDGAEDRVRRRGVPDSDQLHEVHDRASSRGERSAGSGFHGAGAVQVGDPANYQPGDARPGM